MCDFFFFFSFLLVLLDKMESPFYLIDENVAKSKFVRNLYRGRRYIKNIFSF